jgi:hypothetical protein
VNQRRAAIAASALILLVLGVVGAIALGGDDDEPRNVESDTAAETTPTTEPEAAETATEPESQAGDEPGSRTAEDPAEPERQPNPGPAPEPAPQPAGYTPYSASTGDWQAELPSGNGWQAPAERQLGGGDRNRVTVQGPGEAVLLIDHTPSAAARFGGKYRSTRELTQPWFGSMTEYRLGDNSVGYVLNGSESGPGFRVFAIGVSPAVARRVADSLTFVDL